MSDKREPALVRTFEGADDSGTCFQGLSVGRIDKVIWQSLDGARCGHYWRAPGDGVIWVADDTGRIATTVEQRIFRFFRNGIMPRCEHLTRRYLKDLVPVPSGAFAINFGANIGEVALSLTRSGASVLAIEPDTGVLPALRANADGRSIEVAPVAAWNLDGMLRMYVKTESADTSAFNPSEMSAEFPARRIDTLVEERGIEHVHLLIGDAEGAEPEVLEGASRTLKLTEYVSVCASAERNGQSTSAACEAILKAHGFDILLKEESGFSTLIGRNRAFMEKAA